MEFNYLREIKRGTLLVVVLSQLKTPNYGYQIYMDLNNLGYEVDKDTLYPMLRRIEKQGLVSFEEQVVNGMKRKYYQRTELGDEVYCELKLVCRKTNEIVKCLTKEN